MEEEAERPPNVGRKSRFPVSLKDLRDWLSSVMSLTKSVENLKERVEILTKENTRLQRQLDRQAGQIETLAMFVNLSVNKRIGERAAETPEQPMQATESPAQQTPARPRGTRAKKAKPQE